jgi:hypothetical protein
MRVAVGLVAATVLLAGCASNRANEPSAAYCLGVAQVTSVLQGWPQKWVTDRQAIQTLANAYPSLTGAAANDFGGQVQLDVTAFSDDVGRLKLAIKSRVGVDAAMAAILQEIPSLPACPGSPSS